MNRHQALILYRLKDFLVRLGVLQLPFVDRLRPKPTSFRVHVDGVELTGPRRFRPHFVLQEYEPITCDSFRANIKPDMVCLDVGAHIGYSSLLLASLTGPRGRVYAFEPFPENVSYIEKNKATNGFAHIHLIAKAAGNRKETRRFHVTASSDSNSFFDHPNIETDHFIDVEVTPIDDVVEGRVDAAKIDVEGAELLVLEGMNRILSENRDILLWIEWAPAVMKKAGIEPGLLPERLRQLKFDNLSVLDDLNGTNRDVNATLAMLRDGRLPRDWYGNIFARRSLL